MSKKEIDDKFDTIIQFSGIGDFAGAEFRAAELALGVVAAGWEEAATEESVGGDGVWVHGVVYFALSWG